MYAALRLSKGPSEKSSERTSIQVGRSAMASTGSLRSEMLQTTRVSFNKDLESAQMRGSTRLRSELPGLSFVDDDNFQAFIGVVIFSNIFTLWGETDLPDLPIWHFLDNSFLLIFCIELSLRTAYQGSQFFCGLDKWWHLLDVTIVGLGLWDVAFTAIVGTPDLHTHLSHHHEGEQSGSSSLLKCMRLLRLLRLLRLVRMFHLFPSLMDFIKALWEMLHKFVWIFLILFLFMFCSAIILTKLLGQNDFADVEGMEDDIRRIRTMFRTVPDSLFSLFQVTTCDNWMLIAAPAISINPYFRIFFIGYVVFASWILISILTAVASDAMISSSAEKKEIDRKQQEKLHNEFISMLEESIVNANTKESATLSKDEFCTWIDRKGGAEEMAGYGINFSDEEYLKAWDMLDINGIDELSVEDFVSGFSYLHEALCTTHVVNIDYSLKRISLSMENRIDRLREELNELSGQGELMLKSLENQGKMQKAQSLSLWLWQEWVKQSEADPNCLTPDMADAESFQPLSPGARQALDQSQASDSGFYSGSAPELPGR